MGRVFGSANPNYAGPEQLKFQNARQPKALPTASGYANLLQILKTTQQKLKHVQFAPSAPGTPLNFTATAIPGGIELSWGQVIGADGYIIYKSATPDFSAPFLIKVPHANQTFYIDAVGSGNTFYYRVAATAGTTAQPQLQQGNPTNTASATGGAPSSALTVAGNIAPGVKLAGDAGLVNDRVLDVIFDNSGIGTHKPGTWHKANPGQTGQTIQLANGSTTANSGWQKVATGTIDVPPGTQSVILKLVGNASGSAGTIDFLNGQNVGFAISAGAGPASPQATGQVASGGSAIFVTLSAPMTGVGLTLSIYIQPTAAANKFTSLSLICSVNTTTPFQSGTVT